MPFLAEKTVTTAGTVVRLNDVPGLPKPPDVAANVAGRGIQLAGQFLACPVMAAF